MRSTFKIHRFWPAVFLAVCAALPLWRAIFLGEAIGPFDQIRQMAPWNGPPPSRPWDVLQADAVLQFYPWRDMVFESWRHGQLPSWNPYELAGTPLLANSQSAALYPPHMLFGFLHLPTAAAMTLLAWLHLFWAVFGVYFLTRKLGGQKVGAVTAGVCFQLSPFMLGWTALPSVITTVAWIPWVLALIITLFTPRTATPLPPLQPGRADALIASIRESLDSRKRWMLGRTRQAACLSICVAMMLLAGHLQFAAYGMMSAFALTLWLAFSQKSSWSQGEANLPAFVQKATGPSAEPGLRFRPLLSLAIFVRRKGSYPLIALTLSVQVWVAIILGCVLSAPQLVPVLKYSKFSHRTNVASEAGYQSYVAGAIPAVALQSLAFPTALGNPAKAAPVPDPRMQQLNSYWPQLSYLGSNFAETALGVGPLVFVLLFAIRKPKGGAAGLVAVGIISLLLAFGTVLNKPFYFLVPGWSASGSPGRVAVLFVLAACVLAGLNVERLSTLFSSTKGRSALLMVSIPALLGLIAAMAPVALPVSYPSLLDKAFVSGMIQKVVSNEMPIFLATLLIAATAIFLFSKGGKFRAALPCGGALCAFLAYGWNLIPTSQAPLTSVQPPDSQRYAFVNSGWSLLTASHALMPPNTGVYSRIHDIAGYDSLLHRDSVDLLRKIDGDNPAPQANGNIMLVKPTADVSKLADAGVSVVESPKPIAGWGGAATNEGGVYVYRLGGKGRAYTNSSPAQIIDEGYSSITLSASGPGTLTLKDRMMPGWTARVDGKDIAITGNLWRQVDLGDGEHQIVFQYIPPGFLVGLALAAVAAIICIWWLKPWYRPKSLPV